MTTKALADTHAERVAALEIRDKELSDRVTNLTADVQVSVLCAQSLTES